MGGGILPVALKNNKLYFLFGLENELDDTPGWADFGGGHEKHESMFDTAAREGCEELNGFLGCENDIKLQMIQNKILHLKYKTYTSHLFKIDYDDNLPLYYNNNYEFFIKYLPKVKNAPHNGLLEKMQIKWFSMDDIKQLREETSCGVIDCKRALEKASGDIQKAKEILKEKGLELAAKKGAEFWENAAKNGELVDATQLHKES